MARIQQSALVHRTLTTLAGSQTGLLMREVFAVWKELTVASKQVRELEDLRTKTRIQKSASLRHALRMLVESQTGLLMKECFAIWKELALNTLHAKDLDYLRDMVGSTRIQKSASIKRVLTMLVESQTGLLMKEIFAAWKELCMFLFIHQVISGISVPQNEPNSRSWEGNLHAVPNKEDRMAGYEAARALDSAGPCPLTRGGPDTTSFTRRGRSDTPSFTRESEIDLTGLTQELELGTSSFVEQRPRTTRSPFRAGVHGTPSFTAGDLETDLAREPPETDLSRGHSVPSSSAGVMMGSSSSSPWAQSYDMRPRDASPRASLRGGHLSSPAGGGSQTQRRLFTRGGSGSPPSSSGTSGYPPSNSSPSPGGTQKEPSPGRSQRPASTTARSQRHQSPAAGQERDWGSAGKRWETSATAIRVARAFR